VKSALECSTVSAISDPRELEEQQKRTWEKSYTDLFDIKLFSRHPASDN